MLIRIEAGSGVPITRQIVDQVRTQCASGTLAAGDRLPSVRELARQLAVNQNTILRAYERLTAEGILELRHGEGTFVTDFATGKQLRREKAQLHEEAERLVRRAIALGFSEKEIRALLDEAIQQNATEVPATGGSES
jgi:GntR family transcriptional regulator